MLDNPLEVLECQMSKAAWRVFGVCFAILALGIWNLHWIILIALLIALLYVARRFLNAMIDLGVLAHLNAYNDGIKSQLRLPEGVVYYQRLPRGVAYEVLKVHSVDSVVVQSRVEPTSVFVLQGIPVRDVNCCSLQVGDVFEASGQPGHSGRTSRFLAGPSYSAE